jgi:hypothetical protein
MKNGHAWTRRLIAGLGGLVLTSGVLLTSQAGAQASSNPRPAAAAAAQQFCYYSGRFACLNAWGGGPAVNTYTGGIDRNDTHQNFNIIPNTAGGVDLQYTGAGPNNGKCIGDLGNSSTVAKAGLVPCFTGWGTNFKIQQTCSDPSLYTFANAHWKGFLGPVDNWVNGSPFYLNKPGLGTWCFSRTILG